MIKCRPCKGKIILDYSGKGPIRVLIKLRQDSERQLHIHIQRDRQTDRHRNREQERVRKEGGNE